MEWIARHWEILDLVLVILGLAIYITASHTLHQRRHPSVAVAWFFGILLVPYFVLPLFLIFGIRKIRIPGVRKNRNRASVPSPEKYTTAARCQELGEAMRLPAPVAYTHFVLHDDGTRSLDALREIIEGAERTLDICTYILGHDALGSEIVERLERRAKDGVKVRLLIDGIGAWLGGRSYLNRLKKARVETALFVPLFGSSLHGRTNLRNHRKMVIADNTRLWCGGRNLAAEYFEGDPRSFLKRRPWADLSFELRGEVARQAGRQFEYDWRFATENSVPADLPFSAEESPRMKERKYAQLVASGPDNPDDTIATLLISACFTSQRRILIVTPYFVPDFSLLTSLSLAARRGIEVDLVIPAHSNHGLADQARHRLLRELAASGGRVWLFPRMIHAKAVVVDDELALSGSANIDGRSLYLNYEMMIAFYDRETVQKFAAWVEARRAESQAYVARAPGFLRELQEGLILWLAFQL
ncbi:MAG: phospholipase D-like domain-containing protein [Candidatus Accumulibacter sp.]|jgi:cardiolipin synthase|nr:phospholipase D-like domain-containing protein [Accumulibacter sp.]